MAKIETSISSNVVWRLLERFGAKLVTFFVSIILARLLEPTVYGTVALVTVFTTILEVFIDSGLGSALIQKQDADDLDFSSVFYFNVAMCLIMYIGMFVAAPYIAIFYNIPELTLIVRVMSLTLIISGVKNIQYAYISKYMMFKKFFWATLYGTIVSAVFGIIMAYKGFGVWAIVIQPLVNYTIDTIVLWYVVKWRPRFQFSFSRLHSLLSFGWKILVAKLIYTTYNKSRDLIIGKLYSSEDLAFYNRGGSFPTTIVPNMTASIDGVIFPAMANVQNDKIKVRELLKKSIQISSYIVMPLMAGMIACAPAMINVLLTSKWLPCVTFLRMFCTIYAFWPFSVANLNVIRSLGRSEIILKLEILERIFSVVILLTVVRINVFWIGISYVAGEIFSAALCAWPCKKLVDYSLCKQLTDLFPLILSCTIMSFVVSMIKLLGFSDIVTLVIQVLLGVFVFLMLSAILRLDGYIFFTHKFRRLCHR